jgi:hypothetical protein
MVSRCIVVVPTSAENKCSLTRMNEAPLVGERISFQKGSFSLRLVPRKDSRLTLAWDRSGFRTPSKDRLPSNTQYLNALQRITAPRRTKAPLVGLVQEPTRRISDHGA